MAIFTDVITIYNHLQDGKWQRTVIDGVQYAGSVEKTITGDGKIIRTAVVNVTIPDTAECDREYVPAKIFRRMDDPSNSWTLDAEGNMNVIVLGEVSREITAEYRLKNLKEDYECVTVASVTDCRGRDLLKHIKVVCK